MRTYLEEKDVQTRICLLIENNKSYKKRKTTFDQKPELIIFRLFVTRLMINLTTLVLDNFQICPIENRKRNRHTLVKQILFEYYSKEGGVIRG